MTYILSDYCQLFRNKNRLFYSEFGMVIIVSSQKLAHN